MTAKQLKVFVYGTLKPDGKYYPLYCQAKTIEEQKAWTKGKLFDLCLGYPAMIEGDDRVYGFLLTFASPAELSNLDKLEGYSGIEFSPHNEYERKKVLIYDHFDRPLAYAWVYFMTESKVKKLGAVYLSSGYWRN